MKPPWIVLKQIREGKGFGVMGDRHRAFALFEKTVFCFHFSTNTGGHYVSTCDDHILSIKLCLDNKWVLTKRYIP